MMDNDAGKTFTAQKPLSRAYRLGFDAGRNGHGIEKCPYNGKSPMSRKAHAQWLLGLDDGVIAKCRADDLQKECSVVPVEVNLSFERVP